LSENFDLAIVLHQNIRFPAGLEDCYTIAKYILEYQGSKKLHIDLTRVASAGDSASMLLFVKFTLRNSAIKFIKQIKSFLKT
jgi:acetyl esterase/lipase